MGLNQEIIPCRNCGCVNIYKESKMFNILRTVQEFPGCTRLFIIKSEDSKAESTVYRLRRLLSLGLIIKSDSSKYNENGPKYFITANGITTLESLGKELTK